MVALKLKGSSLLESLIALVILLSVLGIGTYIYVNMLSTSVSFTSVKAGSLLREQALEIDLSKSMPNDMIVCDGISVVRKCSPVQEHEALVYIVLKAFDTHGAELAVYEEYRIVNYSIEDETP